mgnify:CR=1 FL=1
MTEQAVIFMGDAYHICRSAAVMTIGGTTAGTDHAGVILDFMCGTKIGIVIIWRAAMTDNTVA